MGSKWLPGALIAAILSLAASAAGAGAHKAHQASGPPPFHPRIGRLMGMVPVVEPPETAVTPREPVVYHGGSVMHGVRLHTVFWAPAGFAFSGSPGPGVPGYEPLVQGFLADAAHDSGSAGNAFSTLSQYGDIGAPGSYALRYAPAADSIDDTAPYPAQPAQCQSPSGVATCVTDLELERELDRVIGQRDPAGRGLHDLWMIFLPPNVDTCSQASECGSNAFGGYHSLFDLGHGSTIYAVVVDPIIEGVQPQGSDPQGNADAEHAADVAAHETVEAVSDPKGAGWMDPDGFEVGDKCDSAYGSPLGFAGGSPYDQLLNGHPYLIQTMWSNVSGGCVQSAAPAPAPAPARVDLRQFSPVVAGNIGRPRSGVDVAIGLFRGGTVAAVGRATTNRRGAWRATLRSIYSGAPTAVGDDRDEIFLRYGKGGPANDLVSTDSGGNPFTASGWTGWFDLDHGYAVSSHSVALAPCAQTGVFSLRVGGHSTPAPVDQCQTETGVSVVRTGPIGAGTSLTFSTSDNRAVWPGNPAGALVRLTIALGEPGSVADVANHSIALEPSGFPTCSADLRAQRSRCGGLVPGARYTLTRRRGHLVLKARAGSGGVADFGAVPGPGGVRGGDLLTLRNRAGRVLSTLHVAHLKIYLRGQSSVVTGGFCQPGDYWGPPVSAPPTGGKVGNPSVGGTGIACSLDGRARGLPAGSLEQTDSFSGGVTRTEVPLFGGTSPTPGETLYGPFVALAEPALRGAAGVLHPVPAKVSVVITRRGSRRPALTLSGLERPQGMPVSGLAPGVYSTVFTLTDPAGDTRTLSSYFVQEG